MAVRHGGLLGGCGDDTNPVSLTAGTGMTGTRAAFMIDNNSHTMFGAPTTKTSTNVELRPWIEAWASGTAAFTTVGP